MKGILLAGGAGTRLHPLTLVVSKQLLPVYNKPMVYYPLSTLMLAGIREILLISTPADIDGFRRLLGDGSQLGLAVSSTPVQPKPEGLAQSFVIGRQFIGTSSVALALGDNIFYGHGLSDVLRSASRARSGATVFAYTVKDPERYGVVEFDRDGRRSSTSTKSPRPPQIAVGGDRAVFLRQSRRRHRRLARAVGPRRARNYRRQPRVPRARPLHVERLGRGIAWLDTGTYEALLHAANFVQSIEERQGLMMACLEEIAYRLGYITADDVRRLAETMPGSYGQHLQDVLDHDAV